MRSRPLLHLICAGSLLMLIAGCLFSPREPESGGAEVCFESVAPKEVEDLFVNLNESLKCLQQTSYEDQLGEGFLFEPTPSAQADFPDVFADDWDREQESLFISLLLSTSRSISVELRETPDLQPASGDPNNGPFCITASYTLTRVDSAGTEITYTGEAEYTLEVFATSWTLTRWVDRETGTASLSSLRGELSAGG